LAFVVGYERMKRRIWVVLVLTVAVVLGAILIPRKLSAARDEAAFQAQLRLARAEGIPTNWREFAATIPTATPSENAAPLYRALKPHHKDLLSGNKKDTGTVDVQLIFHPSVTSEADASAVLANNKVALDIIDKAVKRPKCWFDRDWSIGAAAVLMPELADMKGAARLLALRGSLSATHGDVNAAIADAKRVFVIAGHAGQEGTQISHLVQEGIYDIGVRNLAYWAFTHQDNPAYRLAFKVALDNFPKPNLKQEYRDELFGILSMIDLCATKEGRAELGLREEDIGAAEKIMPLLTSQSKARIRIVQAEREYWSALDRPLKERAELIDKIRLELNMAFISFPTAANVYWNLSSGEDGAVIREPLWQGKVMRYKVLLRALQISKTPPRKIDTSHLLSPFDGKPVTYTFDGKQIVISTSSSEADSKPTQLKIPPDKAIGSGFNP
jgi:hypothetical protein